MIGVAVLKETDPRSRPARRGTPACVPFSTTGRTHGSAPTFFCESIREIENEYIRASWDYRNGDHEREFPIGTFRPPRCGMTTAGNKGAFGVKEAASFSSFNTS